MRYFVVTYIKRPSGQFDETVSVESKIRNTTRSTATVILDYKERKVVKMRLPEDQEAAKDFEKIHEYYNKHYETVIKGLEDKYTAIAEIVDDIKADISAAAQANPEVIQDEIDADVINKLKKVAESNAN